MLTHKSSYRITVPVGRAWSFCLLLLCLLVVTGCGSSFDVTPVDPKGATEAAMEQYDKNGDGFLDLDELAACPGLLAALGEYDLNADKKISKEELGDRIENMYGRAVKLTSVDCKVTMKKKPLRGALVRFVPEEFLGKGTTITAEGTTDQLGYTDIAVPADRLPEELRRFRKTQVGVYRVEIVHPLGKIPAKYNTDTQLGFEVHPDSHGGSHAVFELKAK
jgi:hypothetical protein